MSLRTLASVAVVATLGIACVSTDALAWRGGVYRGGVAWRGGVYRGAYLRPGLAVGAAAVGAAAIAAPYYYNNGRPCGYYPYRPCY
jgi:hypothetical protein